MTMYADTPGAGTWDNGISDRDASDSADPDSKDPERGASNRDTRLPAESNLDKHAVDAVRSLLEGRLRDDDGMVTGALLVVGPPNSGKTTVAVHALLRALGVSHDARDGGRDDAQDNGRAVMSVAQRKTARQLADLVVKHIGVSSQARPVTTLSAIAFDVIARVRARLGLAAPRLLNGAEQDTLLRRVMAQHIRHAAVGDDCATCDLLREYFEADAWSGMVSDTAMYADHSPSLSARDQAAHARASYDRDVRMDRPPLGDRDAQTSEAMLLRGINDAFIVQLRDMISRMNELGATHQREGEILGSLDDTDTGARRLGLQWRLAFALREQYARSIEREYPGEHRLDASRLLVEGTDAVDRANDDELPRCVVVDDVQDLTIAGLSFLMALRRHGCKVVAVGNPDESVQSFRGSYPEYLLERMRREPFHAAVVRLSPSGGSAPTPDADHPQAPDFRTLVAARVSLSIQTAEAGMTPLPQRPGKMPWYAGALPIAPPPHDDALLVDGSMDHGLYRSAQEELDNVVWRIKTLHLSAGHSWNDCAVIAHDNATVRAFGERLRRDGVPVRYSSVTKPLNGEPFVQGLFALIELARLRNRGIHVASSDALRQIEIFVRARARAVMESPLITLGGRADGEPARVSPVETAMRALGALAAVTSRTEEAGQGVTESVTEDVAEEATEATTQDAAEEPAEESPHEAMEQADSDDSHDEREDVRQLSQAWLGLCEEAGADQDVIATSARISVDDRHMHASTTPSTRNVQGGEDLRSVPFDRDALYLLLAADGHGDVHAQQVLAQISAVAGDNPHAQAFRHLWSLVDDVAKGLAALSRPEPQYALSVAWQACRVARPWQRMALDNTDEGRAANDRLDMAMRLFDYAQGSGASHDIDGFLEQIRSMRIEADSLASVAPIDEAVTLTTPSGAAGQHWPLVWVVAVQQGVWPNLAARNTMFGGEDLAQLLLHGHAADIAGDIDSGGDDVPQRYADDAFVAVLAAEQRAFLVALSRATQCVTVSAALSDDMTPSDFLYGYMPEVFDRALDTVDATPRFSQRGGAAAGDGVADMDTDPRGLVALARARLVRAALDRDATRGLASQESSRSASGENGAPRNADVLADGVSRDAADALALLASQGVDAADPANWAYCADRDCADRDCADRDDTGDRDDEDARTAGSHGDIPRLAGCGPMEQLSPSAVDGLWDCPVCWLLEHRLAGPTNGGVAQRFGTVIHRVAQLASEEGLDLPTWQAELTTSQRIEAIVERMMALYRQERDTDDSNDDPSERYTAMHNDAAAQSTLANIASYFALSNADGYLGANTGKFEIGLLERARCEVPFEAEFTLSDILGTCRGVETFERMNVDDLYGIMGAMVGGWPQGMDRSLRIRLKGRIDRLETRVLPDGRRRLRIIDYKTGGNSPSSKHMVNDLQLVCYQLGLRFADHGMVEDGPGMRDASGSTHGEAQQIAQSELFYMRDHAAPAESHGPEGLYQPALFVDGHINDDAFTARSFHPHANILDTPEFDKHAPEGVSDEIWRAVLAQRGSQSVWALNMIARVWYAAAAIRSDTLVAHPSADHRKSCRLLSVCPACAGSSETIFDMRKS